MSTVTAAATKKRKKSDTKPQAQINKCHNEKRRRELENIFIEELADLIQATVADMNPLSVKPDKCAILQETVNQIRNIKQREAQTSAAAAVCAGADSAVQQGEVSSSRPTILANDVIAPLLLEALEGFLFVVNAEGKVEFVTENIAQFIKYTREEIIGKSIYNIIHHGDHGRFSANLLPMSMNWQSGSETSRSRSFNCRLLVKPPDDQDETMEEKQTRVNCYEHMHISSTQVPNSSPDHDVEEGADSGPRLMCVARRIPQCEKTTTAQMPVEQFTTKLDTTGKIVGIDNSGVTTVYSKFFNKDLTGRTVQELCLQQEVPVVTSHLKETLSAGHSTSGVYRLRVSSPDKYVKVQTKSRLFKNNPPEPDFIMATHSIIGSHEPAVEPQPDLDGGSVGGPLMTSVMNGARNGVASRFTPNTSTAADASASTALSLNTSSSFTTFPISNTDLDFGDLFPHSTWSDLEPAWAESTRPDSCQSITPVSTPTRPPSAPVYSPAPQALPSPFTAQQSPTTVPNPPTPANPFANSVNPFPFSPLQDSSFPIEEPKQENKDHVLQESGRLRNLLLKPPVSASDSTSDADAERTKNQILKNLLDQEDDEEKNANESRGASPRALLGNRGSVARPPEQPKQANNMLLKLLNEKNDDDDIETKVGLKNRSELLQQLLKDEDRKAQENTQSQSQDDTLLQSLGFSTSADPGRARKRPSDEREEDIVPKRPTDSVQVSSSGPTIGNSKLCERNKMLASLLAKQPSSTPIPPIPASVISATPQDKLPRVNDLNRKNNYMSQPTTPTSQTNVDRQRIRMPGRPPTSYLNQMLTPNSDIQNQHNVRQASRNQFGMDSFPSTASSSTDNSWDMHSSDPYLSDLLDQVIDIVPDAVMTDNSAIMNILEAMESSQQAINEKMAINAIQKSLMQCETAVKSPSSPTVPSISLPGTPPAYSATMTSAQTNQQNFPPPPQYQRPGNFPIQRGHPVRAGAPQYAIAGGAVSANQQLLLQQQQRKLLQQQELQKRRLLQQQQQQQLLIPSNVQAVELNQGLQNIDNLLNHTVAPNVTLQRSSSVPDSQLSPGYGNTMMNVNNSSQNQRQPYSPHSQLASPLGQQQGYPQTTVNNYQQAGSRLSPHPPFQQQLSPRQGYPPSQSNAQQGSWSQAQPTSRLSLQQQQNPMLNAQLTGNYPSGGRSFPNQRQQQPTPQQQRAIGSPGSAATRQSPFPAESFPPPASPTSSFSQSQFQQQMRLQRTISAPSATTQLPGGLGSPRQYAGRGDHAPSHPAYPHQYPHPHHPSAPPPPQPLPQQHQLMYQDPQYCYDQTQTGLQMAQYGGPDRGRGGPPPAAQSHLQGGASGNGSGLNATSEYVRQELRAVVGARTGQGSSAPATPQSVPQASRLPTQLHGQQVSPADLEALGLTFEMPTSGASDSPKLWGSMGSEMGSMSPQPQTLSSSARTSTEEMARPGEKQNSSLLQKLLSE